MRKFNIGDRVWFAYGDGAIMGWTITKTRSTSYRDDDGKTVQSTMVYMNPDDTNLADSACYEHEIHNDGLPEDDERVIAYEANRQLNLSVQEKSRLFGVAVDYIFELVDGFDGVCEELHKVPEELEYCGNNCQNLNKDCVVRLLKNRAKK